MVRRSLQRTPSTMSHVHHCAASELFPLITLITLIHVTLITQGISRREHPNLLHLVRAVTDAPSDSRVRVTVNVK